MGISLETEEGTSWETLAHVHQTLWRILHGLIQPRRQNWRRDCNRSGSPAIYIDPEWHIMGSRVIHKPQQYKDLPVQFYDCRADAHRALEHHRFAVTEKFRSTGVKRWIWRMSQSSYVTFLHIKDWNHALPKYAAECSTNHKAVIVNFFKL